MFPTEVEKYMSASLGLLGMRERALQFGGQVTIAGVVGQGTTLTLSVPLQPTAEGE